MTDEGLETFCETYLLEWDKIIWKKLLKSLNSDKWLNKLYFHNLYYFWSIFTLAEHSSPDYLQSLKILNTS